MISKDERPKAENKNPLVSVIMPAYNAASYIDSSVNSILSQTYGSLELIVINDGSADDTEQRLLNIAEKDSRLRVLTVENGGPAKARNIGISEANGDYILFIDSDDALLADAVETAVKAAGDSDLVLFGFSIVNPDGSEADYCEPEESISIEDFGAQFPRLYTANLLNQVWAKLYSASLLKDNNISFPDYRWGEDRIFIFDCLPHVKNIKVLPYCGYRYIMHRGESLISRFYDRKFEVSLLLDERIEALCKQFGAGGEDYFKYMFAKSIFSCITTLYSPSCPLNTKEKRAFVRSVVENGRVLERTKGKVAGGFAVKFLIAVMHTGNITLNMLSFRMVSIAGKIAPRLFLKLKHRK